MNHHKGPSIIDLWTGTFMAATITDMALAFLHGEGDLNSSEREQMELLEEATADAPPGRHVEIDLSKNYSSRAITQFLKKHREFELISYHPGRLLLGRKNCDNK